MTTFKAVEDLNVSTRKQYIVIEISWSFLFYKKNNYHLS